MYKAGKLVIGIEHTELKKTKSTQGKTSLAHLKGLHRQIVRKAEQLATEQGIPPINVEVRFNDRFDSYPNKGKKIVQALLDMIKMNLNKILAAEYGNDIEVEVPDPYDDIWWEIYASSGKAHGNDCLKSHSWQVIEPSRIMRRSFLSDLQDRISVKNKKIDDYLKRCDECWLLVVADRSKADQNYYLTPEIKNHRFTSKFKRTFFLEIMERDLLELSTVDQKLGS